MPSNVYFYRLEMVDSWAATARPIEHSNLDQPGRASRGVHLVTLARFASLVVLLAAAWLAVLVQ